MHRVSTTYKFLIRQLNPCSFAGIYRLWNLHIITRPVILTLARMFLTNVAAAAFHGHTAFITLRKMLIAFWVGAVDHFISVLAAIEAFGEHFGIYAVHIN